MEEALRELQTSKFWVLAAVGVVLSVFANFATDWIKSCIAKLDRQTVERLLDSRLRGQAIYNLGWLALSVQALLLMRIDYYWTSKVIAVCAASYYALEVHSIYCQHLPPNTQKRQTTARNAAIFAFFSIWVALFGLPRMIYWLIELRYATLAQGSLLVGVVHLAFWAVTLSRRDPDAA